MLPAVTRPRQGTGGYPGSNTGRLGWLWRHADRLLMTLCLLASLTLLYRCLAITGGLLPYGGGGTRTVISTTTTLRGSSNAGNVVTVTQSEQGMSITVLGGDASLRSRRATLRQAAVQRKTASAAVALADVEQEEPEAFPGLPHDFDAQAGCQSCSSACINALWAAPWHVERTALHLVAI